MPHAKLDIGQTITATKFAFEENGSLILKLTLAVALLSASSELLDVAGAAGLAISLGMLILLGAVYSGMVTALVCLPDKGKNAGELWAVTRPVLARLIWAALVISACVIAGTLAFIVPGLILITLWSVAVQSIVVERKGVFESLGRSFRLVRGNSWRVFLFILIVALVTVLLLAISLLISAPFGDGIAGRLILSFISNVLSTPLAVVAGATLYNQLIALEPDAATGVKNDPNPGKTPPEN